MRFWLAFTLLAMWCFGGLGYAVALLIEGRPGLSFLVTAVVWLVSGWLPRPLAWVAVRQAARED